MRSIALRDLDYVNPRQPLRKTALPPEVRDAISTLHFPEKPNLLHHCPATPQNGSKKPRRGNRWEEICPSTCWRQLGGPRMLHRCSSTLHLTHSPNQSNTSLAHPEATRQTKGDGKPTGFVSRATKVGPRPCMGCPLH